MMGYHTHCLGSHEMKDVGNTATSSSTTFVSEEGARQFRAATDPYTKQKE